MLGSEIVRSPLVVKHNTIPQSDHWKWFNDDFKLECRFKPAIDNALIILEVCPLYTIHDAKTSLEYYRFQTSIVFKFAGSHSKAYIRELVYHVTCLSIDEFNEALQKTQSTLVLGKRFEKFTIEEIEPYVSQALTLTSHKGDTIIPHWKKQSTSNYEENEKTISELIKIPVEKYFDNGSTIERDALIHCMLNPNPDLGNLDILSKCLEFYKICFRQLKSINLQILTDYQSDKIHGYLKYVFNSMPYLSNDVYANHLYRVTLISPHFLERDKVRSKKFLSYPPLLLNKKRGVYNRANSPNNTVFYASQYENVVVRETRPEIGQKIIISSWLKRSNLPLNAFPLCLTPAIDNEYTDRTTYAFEQLRQNMHPVLGDWMECVLNFVSSEFIKEVPPHSSKRYDYIFSAYFADSILKRSPDETQMKSHDCIVYPSVAWNHIQDNLAILPKVVNKHYKLILAREFDVVDTWYNKYISIDEMPAELRLIRSSVDITKRHITWDDD